MVAPHYFPRHHCEKTYLVTLESPVADDKAEQFAKGVQLHNEKDLTKPAVLEVITPTQVRLTISRALSSGETHVRRRGVTMWLSCIVNVAALRWMLI